MGDLSSYKWLITSCLQKSIRRGRFDLAQEYVNFLWTHDKSYLIFRLGTILTEDIGIANQYLVDKYLETKLTKKNVEELGGSDFIIEIVKLACESTKERSSCDAAYLAQYFGLGNEAIESAEKVFNNEKFNYIDRINAGWSILGNKKFQNKNFEINKNNKEVSKDNLDFYLQCIEKITNPLTTNIVKNAYGTQRENICLGMPIIENIYQKELTGTMGLKLSAGKIISHMYTREEEIHHKETGLTLISSGVDGHTREGKTVYYNFLSQNKNFTEYLDRKGIDRSKHIDLLLHSMFRVEGHEVDKRLYFPTAVKVMRDCEEVVLNLKAGTDAGYLVFSEIKNILIESMPMINEMKKNMFCKQKVGFSQRKRI